MRDAPDAESVAAWLELALASRTPRVIGAYEVVDPTPIGEGGSCVVFRVRKRDAPMERELALKMLRTGQFASPEEREQFRADVRFTETLTHANILRIYDIDGLESATPHFTMPWMKRGSLRVQQESFREPRRAAQLIATLARTVQYCHDAQPQPVIHRDIKPENILIGEESHPYLTDFGIAIEYAGDADHPTQLRVGTTGYMSPQQVRGKELTPSTDLYSLGVVLYELLCARRPHEASSHVELLHAILHAPIVAPHKHVPSMPRNLSAIVMCALAQQPARRYASAGAFADDLERFLRGELPLLLPSARRQRAWRWMRHHLALSSALILTVVLGTASVLGASWTLREASALQRHHTFAMLEKVARSYAELLRDDLLRATAKFARTARDVERELRTKAPEEIDLAAYLASLKDVQLTSLSIHDAQCKARARAPHSDAIVGSYYDQRDYHQARAELERAGSEQATIARAHLIYPERKLSAFPVVSPLYGPEHEPAGALVGLFQSREAFARLENEDEEALVLALYGPEDAMDRADDAPSYLMLARPELTAEPRHLDPELALRFAAHFGAPTDVRTRLDPPHVEALVLDDYVDPTQAQDWLAVAAPVGRTGYVLVAQVREAHAMSAMQALVDRPLAYGAAVALVLASIWAYVLYDAFVRRRPG